MFDSRLINAPIHATASTESTIAKPGINTPAPAPLGSCWKAALRLSLALAALCLFAAPAWAKSGALWMVNTLVEENTELNAAEREKLLHDLTVIVWAQNRRVDISPNTTGQQSERHFPFNAVDSLTLLDKKAALGKKAAGAK